jgi:uncharacterized membrane protein YhhN
LNITAAVICALSVALLLVAERRGARGAALVTKLVASAAFVAAGVMTLPLASTFGRSLLAGLVLSAIGDGLLALKSDKSFMAGLASFLLAHVAYGAAFVARGVSIFALEGAALPLLVVGAGVLLWLLPHVPAKLRAPVIAYAVAITAMVALAVGTVAAGGTRWLLVGAVAFYVSDLSVARDRFVSPGFSNRAWGLPLYYAAQIVFALAHS